MLVAQIKTDKRTYSLYSDNIENENIVIYGHYFENNKFYQLNNEVFNEFNKLKLGKNYKKIDTIVENNISYDVILDLNTNLKHYFNNGKENVQMFIYNFKPIIIALSDNQKTNLRLFSALLLTTLNLQILFFHNTKSTESITISQPESYASTIEQLNNAPEFTIDLIKSIISANPNLDETDKSIILNDELLNWAIPYINMNKEYKAKLYHYILPNFKIEKEDIEGNILGLRYYDKLVIDVNKIHNKGKNSEDLYIDVLTHEFTHILMPLNEYSFINEGLTEMITNEFNHLDNDPNNAYMKNQKYIKILMEIIGTEPIIKYYFTGNIDYIKIELINYLPEKKINDLIECFKINNDEETCNNIEILLKEIFYNKYGIQMEDSMLMREWYLNSNEYNTLNYINNPTTTLLACKLTVVEEPITIYTSPDTYQIRIAYREDKEEKYMPKDILLISQNFDEANEKLSNHKVK